MQTRTCSMFLFLSLAFALSISGSLAEEPAPAATPQRPSLSFNAWTVPRDRVEIETGALLDHSGGALPLLVKYGLEDRLELEMGLDVIRTVQSPGASQTSQGDLVLGLRARTHGGSTGGAFAGRGWVKLPTANDSVGSGDLDAGVTGIMSAPFSKVNLDVNLGLSVLGQGGASYLTRGEAIATLGLQGHGAWSPFVEAAWQTTASMGSGSAIDVGTGYAVVPSSVIDAAVGAGSNEGYPDWWVTVGWTILGRPRAGR